MSALVDCMCRSKADVKRGGVVTDIPSRDFLLCKNTDQTLKFKRLQNVVL